MYVLFPAGVIYHTCNNNTRSTRYDVYDVYDDTYVCDLFSEFDAPYDSSFLSRKQKSKNSQRSIFVRILDIYWHHFGHKFK